MTATHTYANVPVSPQTYREIADFFRNLGSEYDHVFIRRRGGNGEGDSEYAHLNMSGYALVVDPSKAKPDHAGALANAIARFLDHSNDPDARIYLKGSLDSFLNRPKGE